MVAGGVWRKTRDLAMEVEETCARRLRVRELSVDDSRGFLRFVMKKMNAGANLAELLSMPFHDEFVLKPKNASKHVDLVIEVVNSLMDLEPYNPALNYYLIL
ncbi:hypothetical protein LR48_Vigan03g121100 [Vigna angularis]|uniref:Uncharacterized protein n=1 Tax=Phaseolus angularis TaxID=3914 RepID=A0A0L9U5X8_PHAAN|nr:hypothetical protein LR48_Vigan03g121100 [Vigna angularis]